MKPVYDAGISVYVCRGNHEVGDMWDAEPGELPDPNDNYSLRWLDVFGNPENDMRQIVIATAGTPGYTWLPPYIGDNSPFLVTPIYHAEQYGYCSVR